MKTDEFFTSIFSPPENRRFKASALLCKERANSSGKNVTIMQLEKRGGSGYHRSEEMVWRDAGKVDSFDDTATFYYIPLSGFQMLSTKGYTSGKEIWDDVTALPGLFKGHIYGVRKSDIEDIKTRKNWKNFEDHISEVLNGKNVAKILMSLVKARLDNSDIFNYNNGSVLKLIDANSPYTKLVNEFKGVEKFNGRTYNVESLFRKFAPNANLSPEALISKHQQELNGVMSRYPLLTKLSTYRVEASDIAEYVNLIDAKKGI
jgi:hypothetical protein